VKNEENIKDWRSTGRRKARKELFRSYTVFECDTCKQTSNKPPQDAPPWFEEIWGEHRTLTSQLQAQHQTKDVTNNDLSVLKWLCPSCHKLEDQETEKGVSTIDTSLWG
jgi:hypothetical protein